MFSFKFSVTRSPWFLRENDTQPWEEILANDPILNIFKIFNPGGSLVANNHGVKKKIDQNVKSAKHVRKTSASSRTFCEKMKRALRKCVSWLFINLVEKFKSGLSLSQTAKWINREKDPN